ncbi:MAG: hypothetical protein R3A79_16115 [Nannocystaceae bacterium]
MSEAQLAKRTAIYAFYARSQLLIIAEGELPSPDYDLDIGQVDESTGPVFELRARRRPGPATGGTTPFRYGEIFSIGRPADTVKLRHEAGEDNVPVEYTEEDLVDIVLSLSLEDSHDVELGGLEAEIETDDLAATEPAPAKKPAKRRPPPPAAARPGPQTSAQRVVGDAPLGGKPVPLLNDVSVRYREATGYSNTLSFDEAFADALKKLPPPAVKFPDMLETVEVVHIGGSFGGIAGFHRLEVRVRAYPD